MDWLGLKSVVESNVIRAPWGDKSAPSDPIALESGSTHLTSRISQIEQHKCL